MKKVSKEDLKHPDKEIRGGLYLIATPIGNFDDISLRAIKLLKAVEILLCEDTRKTKKLLSHLNIKRKNLISYNDNNASNKMYFSENLKRELSNYSAKDYLKSFLHSLPLHNLK